VGFARSSLTPRSFMRMSSSTLNKPDNLLCLGRVVVQMAILKVLAQDINKLPQRIAGSTNLCQSDRSEIGLLSLPENAKQLEGKGHRPQSPL
jgi:hypothetical protein